MQNLVSIVTPVDFNEGGLLKAWTGHEAFPRDLLVKHYDIVPTSVMGLGFKMLRPTNDLAALRATRAGYLLRATTLGPAPGSLPAVGSAGGYTLYTIR